MDTIDYLTQNCVDQQVLPSFTANVQRAFEVKTGTSKKGYPWKIQGGYVADNNGQQAKITLFNCEYDLAQFANTTVTFASTNDPKNGLCGVKVEDDTYQGKTNRTIRIDKQATISYAAQAPQAQPQYAPQPKPAQPQTTPQQQLQQPAPQQSPQQPQNATPRQAELTGELKVKSEFFKSAKLHAYAVAAAMQEANWFKEYSGYEMKPELWQATVSSIFIETCKKLYNVSPKIEFPVVQQHPESAPPAPEPAPQPAPAPAPAPTPAPAPAPQQPAQPTNEPEFKAQDEEDDDVPF